MNFLPRKNRKGKHIKNLTINPFYIIVGSIKKKNTFNEAIEFNLIGHVKEDLGDL
jgi:hypothetical protein